MHMEAQDCCQKASSITFPLCSFSLIQNSTAYLVSEALLLGGSPVSLSPEAGIIGRGLPTCHFMCSGDLNSGCQAFMASVLTTEPSLQSEATLSSLAPVGI